MSCGHESGPWCPAILGPQGSCQRPSAWPVVRGLGLALEAKRTHIKGSLSLGPVGQNNLMKVQEGGCGWWGVGGAAGMCLGQLPGSTAKHVGSANVSGRGRATLGTWPRYPPSLASGRALLKPKFKAPHSCLDANLAPSFLVSEEPGCQVRHFHLSGHSDISMRWNTQRIISWSTRLSPLPYRGLVCVCVCVCVCVHWPFARGLGQKEKRGRA